MNGNHNNTLGKVAGIPHQIGYHSLVVNVA